METKDVKPNWSNMTCYNYPSYLSNLSDQLLLKQPPYSECAYFGKRSLGSLPWLGPLSDTPSFFLDRNNIEFSHEHIIFAQSQDNIGFETDGMFTEDLSDKHYHLDKTCYQGSLLRQAVKLVDISSSYHLFYHNCQDFCEKVREIYHYLKAHLANGDLG